MFRPALSAIAVLPLVLALSFLFAPPLLAQPLSGRVVDAASGIPIADARITAGGTVADTDATGHFALDPGAGRQITVRAPGYWRSRLLAQGPLEVRLTRFEPRALYLSFWGAGHHGLRHAALQQLAAGQLNALVIDVKGDRGLLSYHSRLPLARAIGAQKTITLPRLRSWLAKLREQGIYTIARVVTFKDDRLAAAHPELAVHTADGEVWRDGEGLRWVDPFCRETWDYNIAVAREAAALGFDEVMFDYVRFPDTPGLRFHQPNEEAGRVAAISGFLGAARQALAPANVFTSAAIFGYVCWNRNDTAIGQQLESLAAQVDILAPMLYPSGFQHGLGDVHNPVARPYEIIARSLRRAQERSGLPASRFRPWLQAFRDYAFDHRRFTRQEIGAQVAASDLFGADGWMLWNAANVYGNLTDLPGPRLTAERAAAAGAS